MNKYLTVNTILELNRNRERLGFVASIWQTSE